MNTCAAMARRQDDLSGCVARNSQLLRTRVDIELERQNQELLAQMNNRAKLQLRLQETVEGLSVVAITYYGSRSCTYLAKGPTSCFCPRCRRNWRRRQRSRSFPLPSRSASAACAECWPPRKTPINLNRPVEPFGHKDIGRGGNR